MTEPAIKHSLGPDLAHWWADCRPKCPPLVSLALEFSSEDKHVPGHLPLGELNLEHQTLSVADIGPDELRRYLGKALTRAGWLQPQFDPEALKTIWRHKRGSDARCGRVEFICDTSALSGGAAHWLGELFSSQCDFLITDVTYRELHDRSYHMQQAPKKDKVLEWLSGRQHYLSSRRFIELTGLTRTVVRELANEETNLLLSRGATKNEGKSSEADTLILRTARRAIRERPQNVLCYFVTADTHLARRASIELPPDALITCDTRKVEPGGIYYPCLWWPGSDEGVVGFSTTEMRLVWELLSLADRVVWTSPQSPEFRLEFCAYSHKMWPSDYRRPWIRINESFECLTPHPDTLEAPRARAPETLEGRVRPVADLTWKPAFGGSTMLDLLAAIAFEKPMPEKLQQMKPGGRNVYLRVVGDLDLADWDGTTLRPRAGQQALKEAWTRGDCDYIHNLFLRFAVYTAMICDPESARTEPERSARVLATMLGYIDSRHGHRTAAGDPSYQELASRLREYLAVQANRAQSLQAVLDDVFMDSFQIGPIRVHRGWQRMVDNGVFHGIERRLGGSHDPSLEVEGAELLGNGWRMKKFPSDEVAGVRDLRLEASYDR